MGMGSEVTLRSDKCHITQRVNVTAEWIWSAGRRASHRLRFHHCFFFLFKEAQLLLVKSNIYHLVWRWMLGVHTHLIQPQTQFSPYGDRLNHSPPYSVPFPTQYILMREPIPLAKHRGLHCSDLSAITRARKWEFSPRRVILRLCLCEGYSTAAICCLNYPGISEPRLEVANSSFPLGRTVSWLFSLANRTAHLR